MPDTFFIVACVLIPLGFGLVPAMLPRRVSLAGRWALWLALLGLGACYVTSLRGSPHGLRWLALVLFALSSMLSLSVLIAETARSGVTRRKTRRSGA